MAASDARLRDRIVHRIAPAVAGAVTAVLAAAVIAGWHGDVRSVVQVLPDAAPMQYNTALGLLAASASLLALLTKATRLAAACAAASALLGLATLVQYVTGRDLGIDVLFFEPAIVTQTSHPGRMSPITAACFGLMGTALLLQARPTGTGLLLSRILCTLTLSIGVFAATGHAVGLESYGWGSYSRMAIHTAVGFSVLALGTGLLATSGEEAAARTRRVLLPAAAGATTLAVTVLVWQALLARQRDVLQEMPYTELRTSSMLV